MRNNVITAIAGDKTYIKTDPVFQYDYGMKMIIDGVVLPEEYEVQFGNTSSGANKTVKGDATGVSVPDEYLVNGEDVHAYLYMHTTEDDGYSVYHIHIPVIRRAAIAEEAITPVQHNVIEEALKAMADAVEKTEANVSHYPYINDDKYWMVYDAENDQYVNTGVKASPDRDFTITAGTIATLAPGEDATASVTWEGDTAYLNLGIPAGDTSNLVSIHNEMENESTVIVRDGADNYAIEGLLIRIEPVRDGTGVPSPRNIRRISGVNSVILSQTVDELVREYETSFEDEAGTVYSGTYNPVTGKLSVDHVLFTKNCANMNNMDVQPGWKNSGIREILGDNIDRIFTGQTMNVGTSFGVNTTGDNDILYLGYDQYNMRQSEWISTEITVQICIELPEPVEYDVRQYVPVLGIGDNEFSVNNGKIAYLKYPCDTKKYIDRKIAEVQALALEN